MAKIPSRFLNEIPDEFMHPITPNGGVKKAAPPERQEGLFGASRHAGSGRRREDASQPKLPPIFTGRALLEAAAGASSDKNDGQVAAPQTGSGGQDEQELSAGDVVEHKKFGRGVVTKTLMGRGGDLEIFVHFEGIGVKQLLAKYAMLSRV